MLFCTTFHQTMLLIRAKPVRKRSTDASVRKPRRVEKTDGAPVYVSSLHQTVVKSKSKSKRQFEFFPRFFNATVGLSARSGTVGRGIEFRSVSNSKQLECLLFIVLQENVCCMETFVCSPFLSISEIGVVFGVRRSLEQKIEWKMQNGFQGRPFTFRVLRGVWKYYESLLVWMRYLLLAFWLDCTIFSLFD